MITPPKLLAAQTALAATAIASTVALTAGLAAPAASSIASSRDVSVSSAQLTPQRPSLMS